MALTWRRGVARSEPAPIELVTTGEPAGDYLVQTEIRPTRPPVALQAVRVLQAVVVVIIALISLAMFWTVGLLLGIF
jgi:hypothetical protein